jgi:hypothetical protein
MIEAKPENLIGDRVYDSDPLDETLDQDGIEMIAPHRSNRSKPPTQDRRRLSRYLRRWLVERFFAWIQWQRRILVVGSIIPKTSSVSSSSPALLSCSGGFEIGSNQNRVFSDLQRECPRHEADGDQREPAMPSGSHQSRVSADPQL